MGFLQDVREEFQVIRERDPAIKSPREVLLYPYFWVLRKYRKAHKLYLKGPFLQGQEDFTESRQKVGHRDPSRGADRKGSVY